MSRTFVILEFQLNSIDCLQDAQRNKVEQTEKARLRHKHALEMLQLEEVRILLVFGIFCK